MRCDVFCRVVDNFGDVGFAWRLAADLGSRGHAVRLWIDDASALAWLAREGAPGVQVGAWAAAASGSSDGRRASGGESEWPTAGAGEVVLETFGCGLPETFLARMAASTRPPAWINVEYLSAEPFVQRNHGLPSPQQSGAGAGLVKWYFQPGFGPGTGGLLRELDLEARQWRFSREPWLASTAGETSARAHGRRRVISLFCYDAPQLAQVVGSSQEATLWLVTAGRAAAAFAALPDTALEPRSNAVVLPLLDQADYDHLLWSADLNFVRGEDSFVRAQWAGVPFVWQIYRQQDDAHVVKLHAFLDLFLAGSAPALAAQVRQVFAAWNGLAAWPGLPNLVEWQAHCLAWRGKLWAEPDLTTCLLEFARSRC